MLFVPFGELNDDDDDDDDTMSFSRLFDIVSNKHTTNQMSGVATLAISMAHIDASQDAAQQALQCKSGLSVGI